MSSVAVSDGPLTRPEETPQHMRALAHMNEVRLAAAQCKRDLATGAITLAQALADPRAGCVRVEVLLCAQRRWAMTRATKALDALWVGHECWIPPRKRVGTLTERQRELLVRACSPRRLSGADLSVHPPLSGGR